MRFVKRFFALSVIVFLLIGVVGFKLTEQNADGTPVSWGRAVHWMIMFIVTPGSDHAPSSEASRIFQTGYGILNFFMLTLLLSTVIIPPILKWHDAQTNGEKSLQLWDYFGNDVYLIVGAVDWDKVRSIVEAHLAMQPRSHLVVVVAEALPTLPPDLQKLGVSYIQGSLRDPATYWRAGLNVVTGAYFCAISHRNPATGEPVAYDSPDSDKWTGSVATMVAELKPGLRMVSEQISRGNDDVFHAKSTKVMFDALTLGRVAGLIRDRCGSQPARIEAKLIDEAQAAEWEQQLAEQRITTTDSPEAPLIRVVLPETLDDPESDYATRVDFQRALAAGTYQFVVCLYLSIKSRDLFANSPNALCADEILAEALTAKMLTETSSSSLF